MPRESIPSCHQTNPEACRPGHPRRESTAPSRQGSPHIAPSRRCHSVNFPNTLGNRPRKCPDNSNSKNRLPGSSHCLSVPLPIVFSAIHWLHRPSFGTASESESPVSPAASGPSSFPSTLSSPLSNPLRRCRTCRLSNIPIADPRFQALAPPYQSSPCWLLNPTSPLHACGCQPTTLAWPRQRSRLPARLQPL